MCGAYIHIRTCTYYVVKRGKSVIAIVAFTTALLVRTTAPAKVVKYKFRGEVEQDTNEFVSLAY